MECKIVSGTAGILQDSIPRRKEDEDGRNLWQALYDTVNYLAWICSFKGDSIDHFEYRKIVDHLFSLQHGIHRFECLGSSELLPIQNGLF
mmetsp:Transcript_38810/g.49032  ORF Transcript_38810/g.49032 Transcript_38810/m.49032 type:complete len:90 (-) Transcript_38810:79-348(-)